MKAHSTAGLALVLAVATLGGASQSMAAPDRRPLACGDTIAVDTRLTADLVDCPGDGVVIGADGITLDLNGHRIDGDAAGDEIGIDVEGHRGVTVANGSVREFTEGVLVAGGSDVAIRRLTSTDQGH